jgi:hypothetical protein
MLTATADVYWNNLQNIKIIATNIYDNVDKE